MAASSSPYRQTAAPPIHLCDWWRFMKVLLTCTQEMKELAALAYRDTTAENREFWKNEMGQALREIQGVYEEKLDTMRSEIEASYSLKVTRISAFPSIFHTVLSISSGGTNQCIGRLYRHSKH